ncbi:clarin-3 [Alosa sapidissima]|uniref:clarin-3 n=1 Tax=Alosa sapidissima TaxID=34773 RepID=UPI001C08F6CB|nr:clarin-3 [Alosa sapidissima]
MPTLKKTLHFAGSELCCAGAVALLGYGMSENWSTTTVKCISSNSTTSVNTTGSGMVTIGLFDGSIVLDRCPFFDFSKSITVFGELTGTPLILQYVVIALLALSLIGSAGSILIALYNSISNPYTTYMGPIGLYACSSFSVTTSLLGFIIYVSSVHLDAFGTTMIKKYAGDAATFSDFKVDMQVGFFLVLPYIALNLLAILLVFLYVHAAYTRQREQQKPTEDAPKEIMMY